MADYPAVARHNFLSQQYYVAPAFIPPELGQAEDQHFWPLDIDAAKRKAGESPVAYRHRLFDILFPTDGAQRLVRDAAGMHGPAGLALVLQLDLPKGPVSEVPWECVSSPDSDLSHKLGRLIILRHVGSLPRRSKTGDVDRNRRILVIGAHPQGVQDIKAGIDREFKALKAQEAILEQRYGITVDWVTRHDLPTRKHVSDVWQDIDRRGDSLVGIYFMGHGARQDGEVHLCFGDRNRNIDPVPSTDFVSLFPGKSSERLCNWIVFNCCYSADPGDGSPLSSMGWAVAQGFDIPLVVGFSGMVPDVDACRFGEEFFAELAANSRLIDWLGERQRKIKRGRDERSINDQAVCFVRSTEQIIEVDHGGGVSSGECWNGGDAGEDDMVLIPAGKVRRAYYPEQRKKLMEVLGRLNLAPGELEKLLEAGLRKYPLSGSEERVGAFYLSKYPITNRQYAEFVNDTGYKGRGSPRKWLESAEREPDHPVVDVTWSDAKKYCHWRDGRLPTLLEWKRACRGDDGRVYPWGDVFKIGNCNAVESQKGWTTPVKEYAHVASAFGCIDLVGNVEEWTSTTDEKGVVVVGGSFEMSCEVYGLPTLSRVVDASFRSKDLGFRLARSVP